MQFADKSNFKKSSVRSLLSWPKRHIYIVIGKIELVSSLHVTPLGLSMDYACVNELCDRLTANAHSTYIIILLTGIKFTVYSTYIYYCVYTLMGYGHPVGVFGAIMGR